VSYRADHDQISEVGDYFQVVIEGLILLLVYFQNGLLLYDLVLVVFVIGLHEALPQRGLDLGNGELGHQSADDVDEEEAEQLLPESDDVQPHEGDVEQVGEGDDELVDEELDDDVVLVALVGEVLLVLGELLDERAVDGLVEDVGHQDVHDVGNLAVGSAGVEHPALLRPVRDLLEVEQLVVLVHEAPRVERQHHEHQRGHQDGRADAQRDEVPPAGLQQRHVELPFPRNARLARLEALLVDNVLVDRPILVVACLLAGLRPLLLVLPLRDEDDAPHHHDQAVEEVPGAVIRSVLSKHVEEDSSDAHDGWEDEPGLEEGDEVEVGGSVGAHVAADAAGNDGSVLGGLVDGDEFYESSVLHDVGEGVDDCGLVQRHSLPLDVEVEQVVVLRSQFLLGREQAAIFI
jgi:hypothetical protein